MEEDRIRMLEEFAAFITIFSLLVTITYSEGKYDAMMLGI